MDAAIVCSFCVRERVMWQHNKKASRNKNPDVYGKEVSEDMDVTVYSNETIDQRVGNYEKQGTSRKDARKGLGQPDASTSARAVGR
eukprot:2495543-Rhodomonas_salina.1